MLDELLNEYYERFGENYPLMITSMVSADEVIEDIRKCLINGKRAEPVELEDGFNY